MIRVHYNTDEEIRKSVQSAVAQNKGYCPCKIFRDDTTRCMCEEFRNFVHEGHVGLCHCGLYEAFDDSQ
jgi:ferredoxin-thioredoxin reductase catalytic subunit